jgi:hypothetical protein
LYLKHKYAPFTLVITVIYYSGLDGKYTSKKEREKSGLPLLRRSTRRAGIAHEKVSTGTKVTTLSMLQLPQENTTKPTHLTNSQTHS